MINIFVGRLNTNVGKRPDIGSRHKSELQRHILLVNDGKVPCCVYLDFSKSISNSLSVIVKL